MTMEELALTIKESTDQCNAALAKGIQGMPEYIAARKVLDSAVEDYNKKWVCEQYTRFMSEPIPIIAAIKQRTVDALSVKSTKDKDTGLIKSVSYKTRKGEDAVVSKDIDLVDFENWAIESGYDRVTVNAQWRYVVEKFNYLMCIRTGLEVSGEGKANYIRDNYKISSDARACEVALPTGNREAVRTLQTIVDMIVFVDSGKRSKSEGAPLNAIKVDERDLKYIQKIMNYRKSSGVVGMSRADTMRTLITDTLHVKLTGTDYDFDFEKEAAQAASMPGFTPAEAAAAAAVDEEPEAE